MNDGTIKFSTTENILTWRWPFFPNYASWVIRHLSHSPFSHVDLVMPNGTVLGASDSPNAPVLLGNPRGVAIRPPDYEAFGLRKRMVIKTPLADGIYAIAETQIGKPFDNTALYRFLSDALPTSRSWQDSSAWFCAELLAFAFAIGGYWKMPKVWPKDRISQSDLFMVFLFDPCWVNSDTFWTGK